MLSVFFLPHSFVSRPVWQLANLLITPLVGGLAMELWGRFLRKRERKVLPFDRFSSGFVFGLGLVLVRFLMTQCV